MEISWEKQQQDIIKVAAIGKWDIFLTKSDVLSLYFNL